MRDQKPLYPCLAAMLMLSRVVLFEVSTPYTALTAELKEDLIAEVIARLGNIAGTAS